MNENHTKRQTYNNPRNTPFPHHPVNATSLPCACISIHYSFTCLHSSVGQPNTTETHHARTHHTHENVKPYMHTNTGNFQVVGSKFVLGGYRATARNCEAMGGVLSLNIPLNIPEKRQHVPNMSRKVKNVSTEGR